MADRHMVSWRDLVVYHEPGLLLGGLGELVESGSALLEAAEVVEDGSTWVIGLWPGHRFAAPDEMPAWDTPCGFVDWGGFKQAIESQPGQKSIEPIASAG